MRKDLEKRWLREYLINVWKYLKGVCQENGSRLSLVVPRTETKGNRHKLMHMKFHLHMRRNFFTVQVAKHWNRLHREVHSIPGEFRHCLDTILCSGLWDGPAWNRKVGSDDPLFSLLILCILWFCDNWLEAVLIQWSVCVWFKWLVSCCFICTFW